MNEQIQPGSVVYIIIRNPHAQDVAHVQQAAVVKNPDNPDELALFAHETYYPFQEELAVYTSEEEAEQAYREAFGTPDIEEYFG